MLSQAAGIGSWIYEPDDDRVEWSRDILAITGYSPEDIASVRRRSCSSIGPSTSPSSTGAIGTANRRRTNARTPCRNPPSAAPMPSISPKTTGTP